MIVGKAAGYGADLVSVEHVRCQCPMGPVVALPDAGRQTIDGITKYLYAGSCPSCGRYLTVEVECRDE